MSGCWLEKVAMVAEAASCIDNIIRKKALVKEYLAAHKPRFPATFIKESYLWAIRHVRDRRQGAHGLGQAVCVHCQLTTACRGISRLRCTGDTPRCNFEQQSCCQRPSNQVHQGSQYDAGSPDAKAACILAGTVPFMPSLTSPAQSNINTKAEEILSGLSVDLDHVRQHAVATAGVVHGLTLLLLQLLQMNLVIQQLGAGSSVAELHRKPAPVRSNSPDGGISSAARQPLVIC